MQLNIGTFLETVLEARDRDLTCLYEIYASDYDASSGFDPRDAEVTFAGHSYTLPFGPVVYKRQVLQGVTINKTIAKKINSVSIQCSNVDESGGERYLANYVLTNNIPGKRLVVRVISRSAATSIGNSATLLSNSLILFVGRMDKPDGFNRSVGTLSAKQDLGSIEAVVPARQFQQSCPLEFKGTECLGTEDLGDKAATYQAATTCNFSFAQCTEYENTEFFQGTRIIQITSSFVHKEHRSIWEKLGNFFLFNTMKRRQTTVSNSVRDGTPYGHSIPVILGRWYKQLIPLQFQDIGTSINFKFAACRGKISDFINVRNESPGFTNPIGITEHRGEYGGDGSQTADTVFPDHSFHSRLAYLTGYVNGSDIESEDPAPDITAVIAGIVPDEMYFDVDPDGTGKLSAGTGGTTTPGTSVGTPGNPADTFDEWVLSKEPEAYWKLEELDAPPPTPNTSLEDATDNNHDGSLIPNSELGLVQGISGPVETDPVSYGMSGAIGRVPNAGNTTGALTPSGTQLTICAFAKCGGSGCEIILSHGSDVADSYLSFGQRATGNFADNVYFSLELDDNNTYNLVSQEVTNNVWLRIVAVRDGSWMAIYINGCLNAFRNDLPTDANIDMQAAPWRIGYLFNAVFGGVHFSAGLSHVSLHPGIVFSAQDAKDDYASAVLNPLGCPGEDWTDNPVDHTRHLLTEPSALNNPTESIDDFLSAYAAAWNCGAIKDDTNAERCLLPTAEVSRAGSEYERYTSTGLLSPRSFETTRTQIPAGVPALALRNVGLLGDAIGEFEFYDETAPPTSIDPLIAYRKRFTCNTELTEAKKVIDVIYDQIFPTFRGFLRWNTKGQIIIDSLRPADWTKLRSASIVGATTLTVNDVLPWKTTLGSPYLLEGKLHIGGTDSEVRSVSSAVYSDLGDAITLAASASGGPTATPSGANLTGGSTTQKSSATVTITGTLSDGASITVTIDGIDCVLDLMQGESSATIGHRMACVINADPDLKEYIEAHASSNVVTIYSKIGVLTLSSALEEAHDEDTEVTRVMESFAPKGLTYTDQIRANFLDATFEWPEASRQPLINQIKATHREAILDFGEYPIVVNDSPNQRETLQTNPFEPNHSAVDNYNTSARLANGLLNTFRDGDRFFRLASTGKALLLEEGDVICVTDVSGPFRNVLVRIEDINISPKLEVSFVGRLYSRDQYSDLVANPVDASLTSGLPNFERPPAGISFNTTDFPPNGLTQSTSGSIGITTIRGGAIFEASVYAQYANVRLIMRGGVAVNDFIGVIKPDANLEAVFETPAAVDGLYTFELEVCNKWGCSTTKPTASITIGFGELFLEVPTADVAFSAIAPTVTTVSTLTVPVASVAFTAHAPTASPGAVSLSVPVASASFSAHAPTVTQTSGSNVLAAQVLDWRFGESATDVGSAPNVIEMEVFD